MGYGATASGLRSTPTRLQGLSPDYEPQALNLGRHARSAAPGEQPPFSSLLASHRGKPAIIKATNECHRTGMAVKFQAPPAGGKTANH